MLPFTGIEQEEYKTISNDCKLSFNYPSKLLNISPSKFDRFFILSTNLDTELHPLLGERDRLSKENSMQQDELNKLQAIVNTIKKSLTEILPYQQTVQKIIPSHMPSHPSSSTSANDSATKRRKV